MLFQKMPRKPNTMRYDKSEETADLTEKVQCLKHFFKLGMA